MAQARRSRSNGHGTVPWIPAGALALAALGSAHPAMAQEDVQARSVSERSHPDYSARPVYLGAFEVRPTLEVQTRYDDNIYFTETDRIDDVIISIVPGLKFTDKQDGHRINVELGGNVDRYLQNTSENRYGYDASADAQFGIGTLTSYNLSASYKRSTEARRSFNSFGASTRAPVAFDAFDASGGLARTIGRFDLSLSGRYSARSYIGSTFVSDIEVDLGFRNYDLVGATAKLAYSSGPNQQIYLMVSGDRRDYNNLDASTADLPESYTRDRSSKGAQFELGVTRQISELLFLDVRAGYRTRTYKDPTLPTINGLSFTGDLLWNATPLTSLNLHAARGVDETVSPLLAGTLRTEFSGTVDHELLRNLILSAKGRYAHLSPIGDSSITNESEITLQARYLLNRRWSFDLEGNRLVRDSSYSRSDNRLTFNLKFAF